MENEYTGAKLRRSRIPQVLEISPRPGTEDYGKLMQWSNYRWP